MSSIGIQCDEKSLNDASTQYEAKQFKEISTQSEIKQTTEKHVQTDEPFLSLVQIHQIRHYSSCIEQILNEKVEYNQHDSVQSQISQSITKEKE